MGQNRAQRQIFKKTKVQFRLKNGPRIGVLEPKIGQKQTKKKNSKKFEFKAKTWAKMAKKQSFFKPKLEFQSQKLAKSSKKNNNKTFELKAKTGAKMAKNKTILSQNWSFGAKNWPKIAKKKQ